MKRLFLFSLIVAFVLPCSTIYAAEKAPLGNGNIAVKVDYLYFTEGVLEDAGVHESWYVGLEGYARIVENLYLGAEVGYARPDGEGTGRTESGATVFNDTEINFVSLELNLKYAIKPASKFVIDFGSGVAYNWVDNDFNYYVPGVGLRDGMWLFGGQFFVDFNYTIKQLCLGINAKYQITEDSKFGTHNYNNLRVGGQIGIMF